MHDTYKYIPLMHQAKKKCIYIYIYIYFIIICIKISLDGNFFDDCTKG